jgi:hypothetical protein
MNSFWNFGLTRLMDVTGYPCKITIDDEVYTFQGVLDQQSELIQDDRGVQFVEHMFRLTVRRDIATRIPRDSKHKILVNNETYTVRHILLTGDGETCEIYLTKLNAFSNECNTPEGC